LTIAVPLHEEDFIAIDLPIGYHAIHPDVSLNFQMNRWFSWVGDLSMLDELRAVAPRIRTYRDWQREFLALAQQALAMGQILKAAYYFRSAEFFLSAGDPERKPTREKFVQLMREHYSIQPSDQHRVPYSDGPVQGFLPAYRFTPASPKGTIVFFGGFDSYLEELFLGFFYLRDAGFEVVAFEGPGQGGALFDSGLPMTHEWEKPVRAVLDYFGLRNVTLIGLSMGGYFVIRGAAFEPRVQRAIAYDIFFDSFECNLRQMPSSLRRGLIALLRLKLDFLVNALARRAARRSPVIGWGLHQGMHVTGTSTPVAYLRAIQRYTTADISTRVTQDVLLLAGSEDHYVPVDQFYRQIEALKNARSLTARLFTRAESAQNHCQVGNYGLAFRVMTAWLDLQLTHRPEGATS
jgi:pimeloyl-ACP methyl ester carboxylesterase